MRSRLLRILRRYRNPLPRLNRGGLELVEAHDVRDDLLGVNARCDVARDAPERIARHDGDLLERRGRDCRIGSGL